jgi:hypothetical protein
MADKTTIVNRALSLLGAEPITNLTDDTPEAKIANRFYDESRKSILSECLWNFAAKRDTLNQTTDTLDWYKDDANFVFVLPSDIIRIFGVSSDNINWRIEQEYLIADTDEIGILYVFDQTDTTKFSSSFTDAFADKLAADMAYSVLNSNTEAKLLLEKYDGQSLPKARSENSQVGTPPDIKDDLWSYARFGFSPVGSRGRRIA